MSSVNEASPSFDPRVEFVLRTLGFDSLEAGQDEVTFTSGSRRGRAYLRPGGDRVRGHVALAWSVATPNPPWTGSRGNRCRHPG